MAGIEGAPGAGSRSHEKSSAEQLNQVFEQPTGILAGIGDIAEKEAARRFEEENADTPENLLKKVRRAASRWSNKSGF